MNDTKQKREYWKPSNMLYPLPAVMVSCADEDGRANVMTAAWTGTICSDPVMVYVSIRKERYSHDIIERTGEFVINLTKVSDAPSDTGAVPACEGARHRRVSGQSGVQS